MERGAEGRDLKNGTTEVNETGGGGARGSIVGVPGKIKEEPSR